MCCTTIWKAIWPGRRIRAPEGTNLRRWPLDGCVGLTIADIEWPRTDDLLDGSPRHLNAIAAVRHIRDGELAGGQRAESPDDQLALAVDEDELKQSVPVRLFRGGARAGYLGLPVQGKVVEHPGDAVWVQDQLAPDLALEGPDREIIEAPHGVGVVPRLGEYKIRLVARHAREAEIPLFVSLGAPHVHAEVIRVLHEDHGLVDRQSALPLHEAHHLAAVRLVEVEL